MNMEYHSEALSSWESNAACWDETVGAEGNKYWKSLQEPSLRRLLSNHLDGGRALDLATGNGLTARWLLDNGCFSVIATDGAEAMLDHAKKRATSNDQRTRIEYETLDVTKKESFDKFLNDPRAAGQFDIVLVNMAIMDIANIEPLAQALPRLLKPNGVFVATVLHPVFFTSRATRHIELSDYNVDSTNRPKVVRAKVIRDYLYIPPYRGVAHYGQPKRQVYFHRSMHELFGIFFRAGLVMDAFEEPAFVEEDKEEGRIEASANFTQLPAILSFRMRRPQSAQ